MMPITGTGPTCPMGRLTRRRAFETWARATCMDADPMFHTVLECGGGADRYGLISADRARSRVRSKWGISISHPCCSAQPQSTEVMYLMMKRVFDELGYRRYEWKCDALNAPSCAGRRKRLGFHLRRDIPPGDPLQRTQSGHGVVFDHSTVNGPASGAHSRLGCRLTISTRRASNDSR